MPGEACLKLPEVTAVVTIIWSPQTIGEDQPRPGTSARHPTLIVVDHLSGRPSIAETARPAGPRNCGQVRSAGAGAAGMNAVTKNNTAAVRIARTAAIVSPTKSGNRVIG